MIKPIRMKETSQKILDVQTEMAASKLFILEQCFIIKQNLKLNCNHSLNAESSGDDRELINALLRQIKYLQMELDKKNMISLSIKTRKPYLIQWQSTEKVSSISNVVTRDSISNRSNGINK